MDINLFRIEKLEGDPERIRVSQLRRFADVDVVDEIIQLDEEWRPRQFELDNLRKEFNKLNKKIAEFKIVDEDAHAIINTADEIKQLIAKNEPEVHKLKEELDAKLDTIGNLVDDSVPISKNEDNNETIRSWGEKRMEAVKLKNHVDLAVKHLQIVDTRRGAKVAGHRGFYLKGDGARLKKALIDFGHHFLDERGYEPLDIPLFMGKEIMAKCAQLAQFEEELYKVEGEDKYLIATAEQPLSAYYANEWIQPSELPMRYYGCSPCFRKEAGAHGRDTLGIFRTHHFEKVEQFCVTSPDGPASEDMLEEMIHNSEKFYQKLKLPYRVVSVVSGALNNAASKKYDLEGWFPASQTYRELVSCSNCTDYQSRKLNIRYGQKKGDNEAKKYVHMLNCTLTAAERTMCCILENYQTKDGIEIPEILRPYMGGKTLIPFAAKNKKSVDP